MAKKITTQNLSINDFISAPVVKDINVEREVHLLKTFPYCNETGHILEFGVYKGTTVNIISNFFKDDTVYGFDSFEGLPEPWITKKKSKKISFDKSHFKVDKLPLVNKNVKLVKGYFDETLPQWIKEHNGHIKFLHIDCDLYSSTNTIFNLLNHMITKGTIIVFDELYFWEGNKYDNWEEGEWKALKEWLLRYDREFEIIHRNRHMQTAIKVVK